MTRSDGAFEQGEESPRAAHLTDLWERTWPLARPLGHELRGAYVDRWTRFHSLPESKRYADSDAEYAEILRRHRIVLRELHDPAEVARLWVIAEDWGPDVLAAGRSVRHLPTAWPWRKLLNPHDSETGFTYFWVASGMTNADIDRLLIAAADDECYFLLGAPDLTWLFCPYDGGVDVLLPSTAERDAMTVRHAAWLSSHPQGL